ncbi:efflux transporter outer membrane subunit [uncultured Ramlibacter sp.]|uniref:efflux transporter outer membrane subunit n=1 Tax=uncultured Ramlibacter sp. TaxID=260755 RepID=UPI0026312038|nr:efflux transporter outer membrane subunit [uncultured Ramlibacter sp.]
MTALAAGLLSACTTVGPNFSRPEVPWLADWSPSATTGKSAQAQPKRAETEVWWSHFKDPVLDQLIAEAQRRNVGVRVAGLRILEARAQLGIAGSTRFPQVQQVTGEALRVRSGNSSGAETTASTAGIGASIAWEIDFWGKFRRGIEAADANYLSSIAQYDDAQVLVAAQTASLYSSVRTIELRLTIAQENAALQKRSMEITERLFKSGNESELDVQQAKSQYLSTLATIPDLEGSLRQTQNALSIMLARPPGAIAEMDAGRAKIPLANLDVVVDLPAELLRRRPDVRTAEMLLAAQSALIGVSEAALYPSIALVGSMGLSANSKNWSMRTLDWALGPALVWNIFDYGRLKNQILVEDARFQQLHENYLDTVLRAAREMDDAAIGFAKGRVQVDILREAVQAARRSLDIANIQYREGLVDFQRVLDAQRTLFSQQDRLVGTQGGVTQSLVSLYKAVGGGWQAGRTQPLLDDATRETMAKRSSWQGLLDAPLPPPSAEDSSASQQEAQ